MKTFSKKTFILAVVIQLAVLAYMVMQREYLLSHGKKVMLKCQPVDPRSLLSGDYIILSFSISRFDKELLDTLNKEKEKFQKNDTVYVALDKGDNEKFWKAIEISSDYKKLKVKYPVVIKGVVDNLYTFSVRYGLESYFVPQNQGTKIEQQMNNVHVEASVSESGESALSRLFLNDREVMFY